MNRQFQIFFVVVGAVLVALSLTGVTDSALKAVGVDGEAVQMTDAVIGLAGLLPLILLWISDQRRDSMEAERVKITLVAEDGRKLLLPYQPPRREVKTRAGLFGVLGGVAGARRFDVGHALLNVVSSGAYDDLVAGRRDSIEIPVPDREFDEFTADSEAFERGEVRKPAPRPAPKPDPEIVKIQEALDAVLNHLTSPGSGKDA